MAANDLGIIDGFLEAFSSYIDHGFGLLSGDVAFLSTILIGIDVTLTGLFWAMSEGGDPVLARLARKVLYVGFFAYLLNDFGHLADVIYQSFAGLGLKASGSTLAAADLLKPGAIASTGYSSAHPLLVSASNLVGFPEIFSNFLTVFVLLLAWLLVIFAFFILAIQLFISVLEFKLTTLAGFVLVPFALWNKTAFLAERVLGNVIASGIKMMVLAVIVGIGSTVFASLALNSGGEDITMAAAMSQVLGALALFGLGIFGPGIASGLVAGAPQLGAGAALGTAGAAAGSVALAGGSAYGAARMAGTGTMAVIRAAAYLGNGTPASEQKPATAASSSMKRLRSEQASRAHRHAVHQAIKDGDKPGHGASPSLQQKDDHP